MLITLTCVSIFIASDFGEQFEGCRDELDMAFEVDFADRHCSCLNFAYAERSHAALPGNTALPTANTKVSDVPPTA